MTKEIVKLLFRVRERVQDDITEFARTGDGFYSSGLAGEGYNGGYLDALDDFLNVLDGVKVHRNDWWDE